MQYYYIEKEENDLFILNNDDTHHILNVMRMKNNDEIIVNYQNIFYLCNLIINNQKVYAIKNKELEINNELPCSINLIYGIPKGEKLDLVIQKSVELGVSNIYLWQSERSIVKFEENKIENKIIRFNKIIKEAGEQSHRNKLPKIHVLVGLKEIIKIKGDINLLAYEEESCNNQSKLFNLLNTNLKNKIINIIVGPEGGISNKEVKFLSESNYQCVSLGKRILRSETACINFLSIIAFMAERD